MTAPAAVAEIVLADPASRDRSARSGKRPGLGFGPVPPTIDDVHAAREAIAGHVFRTPLLPSESLSALAGRDVYLKAELFQRAGSFKTRGAFNRILLLSAEERRLGVITVSAGNHAAAVALAALACRTDALVLMPAGASPAKIEAASRYGATVDLESADAAEAFERMQAIVAETGRVVIHPFDDPLVMAGAGTVGLEILEDLPDVDAVIAPVGGGGLLAGISIAVRASRPTARMIAAQPLNSGTLDGLARRRPADPDRPVADRCRRADTTGGRRAMRWPSSRRA